MVENKLSSSSRLERKKLAMKQKIIDVSMKSFLKQGIDATTMEQIAEAVDIAKGTLYNYFPVKEAIIDEYIKLTFQEQNPERIEKLHGLPDTRSRMIATLNELMSGIQRQKDIFEKYFIYRIQKMIALRPDESAQSGLNLLENEIIQLGQKEGEIRTDLPIDILTGLFEFVFIKVAQQFYQEPESFDPQRGIEQCVELFMNGVGA